MDDVLSHISDYVPTVPSSKEMTLSNGEIIEEDQSVMHSILLGGDQMTAARVRAAKDAKANAQTSYQRYEGIVPVLEDWHTKGNFMKVSSYRNMEFKSLFFFSFFFFFYLALS